MDGLTECGAVKCSAVQLPKRENMMAARNEYRNRYALTLEGRRDYCARWY